MKNEKGITMLVVIFAIIILLIITVIALSFVIGENGALVITSEQSFKNDMQQIKEKVELKQTEYDLEDAKDISLFTRNKEYEILEDYSDKMRISCIFDEQQDRVILYVYYNPEKFTDKQIEVMQSMGFTEDVLTVQD